MNFLAHAHSLGFLISYVISFPTTNLYIISHYYLMQLNVSKERLTLTTVFHQLLPPGKHWA